MADNILLLICIFRCFVAGVGVKKNNEQQQGFSLLEISIVLLIVGALLVSGVTGLAEHADANENIVYLQGAGDNMPIWLSQSALKSQP